MKKNKILLCAMAALLISACSQKKETATTAEGTTQVVKEGTPVKDDNGTIRLLAPDTTMVNPMMQAFLHRASTGYNEEYSEQMISLEHLSNLLWAANGFNRADKRTAPSALNKQDVDIYVCLPFGAYLYNAKENLLSRATEADLRSYVAGQQKAVATAPVCLVMVTNWTRFDMKNEPEKSKLMGSVDAAYVSANIGLYCAATGLLTRPRMSADWDTLQKSLQLTDGQQGVLNNPVGYKKD